MKITLHVKPTSGLRSVIRTHPTLAKLFPEDGELWIGLSDADPVCESLFKFCASYEPKPVAGAIVINRALSVSTEFHFDANEWDETVLFHALAGRRSRVPVYDDKVNFTLFLKEPLVDKGGWNPIRIATTFSYSKHDVNPRDMFGVAWADEYAIGLDVESAFTSSHLSGFRAGPVLGKGRCVTNPSCYHLVSDNYTLPCVREATVWDRQSYRQRHGSRWTETGTRYVEKGLVCLPRRAFSKETADFYRSSDPLAPNNGAGWLVSRRVVETVARHKLLGWWFGPVLIEGSLVFEEYLRRMNRIESWISMHPYNDFSTTKGGGVLAKKIIVKKVRT